MKTANVFGFDMDAEEIRDRLSVLWDFMPQGDEARNYAGWDEIAELEAALKRLGETA